MTPLLDALYQYVMEKEMLPCIDKEVYDKGLEDCLFHENALKSTLNEAQREQLKCFIQASDSLEYVQSEAIFQAALSIGLILGALPYHT